MKNVILSADGDNIVYSVPDEAADNLCDYCIDFCKWLQDSTDAEKYRINGVICYNDNDFIEYLNKWLFPKEPSKYIKNIGFTIPEEYRNLPHFNF